MSAPYPFATSTEYAKRHRVSRGTVSRWIGHGLPVARPRRSILRIPLALGDQWVAAHRRAFEPGKPVVYVLGSEAGPIKIGFTRDLSRRMHELHYAGYGRVHVEASFPGSMQVEWSLHRLFDEHRLEGEWFRPSPLILSYVRKMHAAISRGDITADVWLRRRRADGMRRGAILRDLISRGDLTMADASACLALPESTIRQILGSKRPLFAEECTRLLAAGDQETDR